MLRRSSGPKCSARNSRKFTYILNLTWRRAYDPPRALQATLSTNRCPRRSSTGSPVGSQETRSAIDITSQNQIWHVGQKRNGLPICLKVPCLPVYCQPSRFNGRSQRTKKPTRRLRHGWRRLRGFVATNFYVCCPAGLYFRGCCLPAAARLNALLRRA